MQAPEGLDIRPTSDRARQGLFNILEHGSFTEDGTSPIVDSAVLDAFAGTGALGLEALSRGTARLTCMDSDPRAVAAIRANVATLGERARVTLHQADATRPPPGPATPCNLVFLDPPYRSGLAAPALTALADRGWVAGGALCIVEIEVKGDFMPPPGFTSLDERRYGKARFVFLRFGM